MLLLEEGVGQSQTNLKFHIEEIKHQFDVGHINTSDDVELLFFQKIYKIHEEACSRGYSPNLVLHPEEVERIWQDAKTEISSENSEFFGKSTPKNKKKDNKEESPGVLPQTGSRRVESTDPDLLSGRVLDSLPDVPMERMRKYGVFISLESMIHFENLICYLDLNEPEQKKIFDGIMAHYQPQFKSGWGSVVSKDESQANGYGISVQMTKNGVIRFFKDTDDLLQFFQSFMTIFAPLGIDLILELAQLLYLESKKNQKNGRFIHDAREVGPKSVVDRTFKGVTLAIQEFRWGGKPEYKVYIDYSDKAHPHIEGEGKEAHVKSFLDFTAGSPEFFSNLNDMRDVSYYTWKDVNHVGQGVNAVYGAVDEMASESRQSQQIVLENLDEVKGKQFSHEIQTELYQLELKEHIKRLLETARKTSEHAKANADNQAEMIMALGKAAKYVVDKYEETFGDLESDLIPSLNKVFEIDKNLTKVISGQDDIKNEVSKLNKTVSERFDLLEDLISSEFTSFRKQSKNNLYLVLRAIHKIPSQTSKELIETLTKKLDRTKGTIYRYLRELREKGLIKAHDYKPEYRPGKPTKLYTISKKVKEFFKKNDKTGSDNKNEEKL